MRSLCAPCSVASTKRAGFPAFCPVGVGAAKLALSLGVVCRDTRRSGAILPFLGYSDWWLLGSGCLPDVRYPTGPSAFHVLGPCLHQLTALFQLAGAMVGSFHLVFDRVRQRLFG